MSKIARTHAEIESIEVVVVLPELVDSNGIGARFEARILIDSISGCFRSILLISRNSAPSWSEVFRKYWF